MRSLFVHFAAESLELLMCCNSVIWLSEVCYNVSIADSVVYNKLYVADMLQSDISLSLSF